MFLKISTLVSMEVCAKLETTQREAQSSELPGTTPLEVHSNLSKLRMFTRITNENLQGNQWFTVVLSNQRGCTSEIVISDR